MLLFTHCDGALYCPGVTWKIDGSNIITFSQDGKRLNSYPVTNKQIETLKCEVK